MENNSVKNLCGILFQKSSNIFRIVHLMTSNFNQRLTNDCFFSTNYNVLFCNILQGVPKKMVIWKDFEFLTLGWVFLGVKNNSKNFGNQKNIWLFSKILSKWTFSVRKMQKILCFYKFMVLLKMESIFKCYKRQYLWICTYDF